MKAAVVELFSLLASATSTFRCVLGGLRRSVKIPTRRNHPLPSLFPSNFSALSVSASTPSCFSMNI